MFLNIAWSRLRIFVGDAIAVIQRLDHLLIGEKPISPMIIQVIGAILEEDLNRTDGLPSNESRVILPTVG